MYRDNIHNQSIGNQELVAIMGVFRKEKHLPESAPLGLLCRVWLENDENGPLMMGLGKIEVAGEPVEVKWKVNLAHEQVEKLKSSMQSVNTGSKKQRLDKYFQTMQYGEDLLTAALADENGGLAITREDKITAPKYQSKAQPSVKLEIGPDVDYENLLNSVAMQIDLQEKMQSWRYDNVPMNEIIQLQSLIEHPNKMKELCELWKMSKTELGEFVQLFDTCLKEFRVKDSSEMHKLIDSRRKKIQKYTASTVWKISTSLLKEKYLSKSRWMLSSSDMDSMVNKLIQEYDATGKMTLNGVVEIVENVSREMIKSETTNIQAKSSLEVKFLQEHFSCMWARRIVRERMENNHVSGSLQDEVFDDAVTILADHLFIQPHFNSTKMRVIHGKLWNSIISSDIDPRDVEQVEMRIQLLNYLEKYHDDNQDESVDICDKEITSWLTDYGFDNIGDNKTFENELRNLWETSKEKIPDVKDIRQMLDKHIEVQTKSRIRAQIVDKVEGSMFMDDLRLLDKLVPNRAKVWREWVGVIEQLLCNRTTPARLMPHLHLAINFLESNGDNSKSLFESLPITYQSISRILSIESILTKPGDPDKLSEKKMMIEFLNLYRRSVIAQKSSLNRVLSSKASQILINNLPNSSDPDSDLIMSM